MLTKLERYIDQLGELNNKLIVLAGPRGSGKTKLLKELGKKLGVEINIRNEKMYAAMHELSGGLE